jgi:hypothetical protein
VHTRVHVEPFGLPRRNGESIKISSFALLSSFRSAVAGLERGLPGRSEEMPSWQSTPVLGGPRRTLTIGGSARGGEGRQHMTYRCWVWITILSALVVGGAGVDVRPAAAADTPGSGALCLTDTGGAQTSGLFHRAPVDSYHARALLRDSEGREPDV